MTHLKTLALIILCAIGSQTGNALAVHDAVGDQPHGPGDHVAADVPLR